jgi:hypothetical protein
MAHLCKADRSHQPYISAPDNRNIDRGVGRIHIRIRRNNLKVFCHQMTFEERKGNAFVDASPQ